LPAAAGALRPLAVGAGNVALAGGRTALSAAARAPAAIGNTAKFMANVPRGQPFAPTPLAAVKNTANLAFRPRYPGVDRMPGLAAEARPLDRTRAALGTAARVGGVSSLGLSAAVAIPGALQRYPDNVADEGALRAGLPQKAWDDLRSRARANAPAYYAQLAKQIVNPVARQALGPETTWPGNTAAAQHLLGPEDRSAFSRMHGAIAREAAVPLLRSDVYQARKTRPWLFGAADTLRSLTPAGAAMTAGLRAFGSAEQPDLGAIVARHARAYGPEIAADPEGTKASPFAAIYRDMQSPLAASRPVARAGLMADRWMNRRPALAAGLWGEGETPFWRAGRQVDSQAGLGTASTPFGWRSR
jgi:hypothetical protein